MRIQDGVHFRIQHALPSCTFYLSVVIIIVWCQTISWPRFPISSPPSPTRSLLSSHTSDFAREVDELKKFYDVECNILCVRKKNVGGEGVSLHFMSSPMLSSMLYILNFLVGGGQLFFLLLFMKMCCKKYQTVIKWKSSSVQRRLFECFCAFSSVCFNQYLIPVFNIIFF